MAEKVGVVDGGWAGRMLRHPGGMHSLFPKAGSEIRPCISLRFRSFDTWNEARNLSLRGLGKICYFWVEEGY